MKSTKTLLKSLLLLDFQQVWWDGQLLSNGQWMIDTAQLEDMPTQIKVGPVVLDFSSPFRYMAHAKKPFLPGVDIHAFFDGEIRTLQEYGHITDIGTLPEYFDRLCALLGEGSPTLRGCDDTSSVLIQVQEKTAIFLNKNNN